MQAGARGAEEIRASLARVLEREGIEERSGRSVLERLLEWLGVSVEATASTIAWLAPTLLVVFVAVLLARHWNRLKGHWRGASPGREALRAARALRVAELRERARAAEAGGDLALALRLEFFALVVALSEHGELEFRPAWTNRELLARGEPAPELRARLAAELDVLDPKTWGTKAVVPDDLAHVRALAGELLAEKAA